VGMARRTLRDVADPGRIIEEFHSGRRSPCRRCSDIGCH
jgi:hypothetical protein